jgi:hypothetical protein
MNKLLILIPAYSEGTAMAGLPVLVVDECSAGAQMAAAL